MTIDHTYMQNTTTYSLQEKRRSKRQNSSLHKYLEEASRECNNAGVDVSVMVKQLRVDTTPEFMKDIFREIGKVKFGKVSTAHLTTKELNACVEEYSRMLGNVGITISFPSFENTPEYLNSYIYDR